MEIASHCAGRIRIRDERLKHEGTASGLCRSLLERAGVVAADASSRVGSLLIHYAPGETTGEAVFAAVAGLLDAQPLRTRPTALRPTTRRPSGTLPARLQRRIKMIGMLASLLLSVAAAALDLKKLHILAGVVFLALFGDHLYERRGMLFA